MVWAEESAELTRPPAGGLVGCFCGLILGMTRIEQGSPDRGVDVMVERAGGASLPRAGGGWNAYFLDWLTRGLIAAGRTPEAEEAAARARAVAEATGLASAAAAADRAAARVALCSGEAASAAERALAAAGAADALGAPIEAGLSRILAARALVEIGDKDRAADELDRAATAFDAIGAVRYRAEAERELRRLGSRRHRRSRPGSAGASGVASLTEREREVARLIVDRRTNPQIAAELFLSQKTVESHVRNLFHKLGVASRVEVARVVEQADAESRAVAQPPP